ncbi:MAG: type I methionyl aminopeptidase [Spirochaetia bacterium]|nr:type I methionyl aminopeptidase [Spirochaetia bacterium]
MIRIKSKNDIEGIRDSGAILAETFEKLKTVVAAGITTEEIDDIAREFVLARHAKPACLGYMGFPKSVCISVNDEVIHGIPGKRVLHDGDIVSLDFCVDLNGYISDSTISLPVGKISPEAQQLLKVTEEALYRGIEKAVAGNKVMDISRAVFVHAKKYNYGVVRDYCGHGVGFHMHEEPQIPNYIFRGSNPKLKDGYVIAIEPMITMGTDEVSVLDNDWTVVTDDGSWAAHFEHTVAVHEGYAEILTKLR